MIEARGANEAFARCLVDEWVRLGVGHACISPGSRSAPLALALVARPEIRCHVLIDERSAAFFALGIAREGRSPVPVLCTSGTAVANLHPALAEARHGGVPLIALTADRPPELRGTGANQTVDQIKMFGDAVKWFVDTGVPEQEPHSVRYWRSLACRAWFEASGLPAGPVHLNVPLREPLVPAADHPAFPFSLAGRDHGAPWTRAARGTRHASDDEISSVVETITGTTRGVIVVGASQTDASPLLELGRRAGWPILAEPASNLRVPGTIGSYDGLLRAPGFVDHHRPDVALRVGRLGLGRPLSRYLADVPQIALDEEGIWHDEQRMAVKVITADLADVCGRVSRQLEERPSPWLDRWVAADAAALSAIRSALEADDLVSEPRTARDLARHLPDESDLVVGSSMPVRDLDSFMEPRTALRIFANRGVNGIDGFVSTTLGIAASSGRPTFSLVGDLAFLYDQNGLLYPDRARLDVTFVVLNNDGGGIFSFLEQAGVSDFERVFGTPHGIDLGRVAAVYGCGFDRLERISDLPGLLGAGAGPRIIEATTTREGNVATHDRIWAAVEDAVSRLPAPPASHEA
ncbi:MAG: 2-succinyl-5-enolpyruvyl-6-hydroxy-3-cyclohexene-1-carboxylic-acid synthase [Actinomycetota bacterium]